MKRAGTRKVKVLSDGTLIVAVDIAALGAVRELRRLDPAKADELFNLIMPR